MKNWVKALALSCTLAVPAGEVSAFSGDQSATTTLGSCSINYVLNEGDQFARVALITGSDSRVPEGSFYSSGGTPSSANSPITEADIAGCLQVNANEITITNSNGADSTFVNDTYIGFAFTYTGNSYEYALFGGTNTIILKPNPALTAADTTDPDVAIFDAPSSVSGASDFTVGISFSEDVTGFEGSDLSLGNATLVSLTGSGASYTAALRSTGTGTVTIVVPAGVAVDSSANPNTASNTVTISDMTVSETQMAVAGFMQGRANQLVANQPQLSGFLRGSSRGGSFDAAVTRGAGHFNFVSDMSHPVWMQLQGARSENGTSQGTYAFGVIGSHMRISDTLLIGAMLQFDHQSSDDGAASLDGTGWMVGPYFAARAASQDLYFEGRLLYGQTANRISPLGTYEDSFDTERFLAQFQMSGEVVKGTTVFNPFVSASYAKETQEAYTDGLSNVIGAQEITQGQVAVGLDFSMPVNVAQGELQLTGGLSGIWSETSSSASASSTGSNYQGQRARVELGLRYNPTDSQNLSASIFLDGIGANNYQSYGATLGYQFRF